MTTPRLARRAEAIGQTVRGRSRSPARRHAERGRRRRGRLREIGVTRLYPQVLDLADLDHVEQFASEVVGQLG